jgi:hypothetical protein
MFFIKVTFIKMALDIFHNLKQNGVLVYGLDPLEIPTIARAYGRRVYVVEAHRNGLHKGRVTYLGYGTLNHMISKFSKQAFKEAFSDAMVIIPDAHLFVRQDRLFNLVLQQTTVKLVLLSPTPLLGEPGDIVLLLNLLRRNDKLPLVTTATLMDAPYVRFVSKQYSVPHRVYPKLFDPFSGHIVVPNDGAKRTLENIDVYPVRCSEAQAAAYHNALRTNENTQLKQGVLMSLTMAYPNGLYGKDGLQSVMACTGNGYEYLPGAEHVFSNLPTYSAKLNAVCTQAATATGVLLVFTKFIEGGAVPVALALESTGFRRYGGRSLLNGPNNGKQYIMLTRDSPTNAVELEAATKDNAYGTRVKVIITTGNEFPFKNVRQVHVLEPWWHMERMEHLMRRCASPDSHSELPPHERNIQIFMYVSVLPHDEEGYDRHMYRYAETRSVQIGKIANLLKGGTVVTPGDAPVRQTLADGQRVDPPTHDLDTWMGAS